MPSFCNALNTLTDEEKAAALNLAFLLEMFCYDETILNFVSIYFTESQKRAIYAFWAGLTPATQTAYLCMVDFEGKI